MSSSQSASLCRQCGAPMHAGVGGLCAGCLAATAFGLEEDDEALESVAGGGAEDKAPPRSGPDRLGDYELMEELGRGGMGVVYRARQGSLDRDVALKVIPGGPLADPDALHRFRMEARAAARLHHPHVVPVYEVGETGSHAYFSMELIAGPTLSQRVRRGGPLPPRAAAACVGKIASAIQHAHEQGLLHRDLKPSNILIDPEEEPRVADFGLVKSTGTMVDGELTLTNQSVGTPAWFAPEQAGEGEALPQTDVYGLGALLYFSLTGRVPFPGRDMAALLDQVRNMPPVAPRVLDPSIPRDLETICLKAMEKAPARRYATAREMAEDLGRWLAGDPILARPVTRLTRMVRWVQRHRALSAALAGLALTLITAGGIVTAMWLRAERAAAAESVQRQRAEEELWQSLVAVAQRERSSGISGGPRRAMEAVRRAAAIRPGVELRDEAIAALVIPDFAPPVQWSWKGKLDPRLLAREAQLSPTGDTALQILMDGRGLLLDVQTAAQRGELAGPALPQGVQPVFSTTGQWITALLPGGQLRLWNDEGAGRDLSTGDGVLALCWSREDAVLALLRSDHLERIALPEGNSLGRTPLVPGWRGPMLSPDAARLAIGHDRELSVLDCADGRVIHRFPHQQTIENSAWSQDGRLLVVGTHDNRISVWDTESGLRWCECDGHDHRPAWQDFISDELLMSGSWDSTVRLWNPRSGRCLLTLPLAAAAAPMPGTGGRFVQNADWLSPALTGLRLPQIIRTLRLPATPASPIPGNSSIAFAPEQPLIFSAGSRGISVWHAGDLRLLGSFRTEGDAVTVIPGQDGSVLCSTLGSGVIRTHVRDLSAGPDSLFAPPEPVIREQYRSPFALAVNAIAGVKPSGVPLRVNYMDTRAGRTAVSCVGDAAPYGENVEIWEAGRRIRRSNVRASWPVVSLSPDGAWLATGGSGYPVLLRVDGPRAPLQEHALEMKAEEKLYCTFSPDGSLVAYQSASAISLWEVPSRRLRHRIPRPAGAVGNVVAFSPDGSLLAALGRHWDIWLIDPRTGARLASLTPPEAFMTASFAFSPDGGQLAAGLMNGTIQLWDLGALRKLLSAEGLDWQAAPP